MSEHRGPDPIRVTAAMRRGGVVIELTEPEPLVPGPAGRVVDAAIERDAESPVAGPPGWPARGDTGPAPGTLQDVSAVTEQMPNVGGGAL